jgi:hypothetical protein
MPKAVVAIMATCPVLLKAVTSLLLLLLRLEVLSTMLRLRNPLHFEVETTYLLAMMCKTKRKRGSEEVNT